METLKIVQEMREHIPEIIQHNEPVGLRLWQQLIALHPADIARFLSDIDKEDFKELFLQFDQPLKLDVFEALSIRMQIDALAAMDAPGKVDALNRLPADELTDLFEILSDQDLKKYLDLLHKTARDHVVSLMQFPTESAGGIMNTEILTLRGDFTVQKSISILQRLRPSKEIYQQIYVTNREHKLMGYIELQDLVLQLPNTRITSFLHPVLLAAIADEDREEVAQKMVHYSVMSVPVVDTNNHLLGIIQSDTLVDVLVEEASENVQKMAALTPLKYSYFETSFFRLFYQRSYILLALFIAQSFSTTIMHAYESTLRGLLLFFTTMLISTGGNASNQTSAVIIQGMATGDINSSNIKRFIRREILMALILATVLGTAALIRGYITTQQPLESFAIALSQAIIVVLAISIGSCVPILLKYLNIDPAFAAGPILATFMDILGILIYCIITRLILL